jgi:hypothetical protein
MAYDYACFCTVNSAGASVVPAAQSDPNTYVSVNLTDTQGNFFGQDFICADQIRRELLAVALAAISTGRQVRAMVDSGPYGNGRPTATPGCGELDIVI